MGLAFLISRFFEGVDMRRKTERLTIQMSPAERRMLEHLAMCERVSKAFIVRRLIRDAARDLYSTIKSTDEPIKNFVVSS